MKKENKTAFSADRCYKITHSLTGKLLTAREDGSLCVAKTEKGDSQKWFLKENGENLAVVSKLTGNALDVVWGGTENGARLHLWERCEAETQLWRAEKNGTAYKLISAASGKCADVEGISEEDGAAVQLWDDLGGENQMWKISAVPVRKPAAKKAEAKKAPAKKAKPAAKKAKKK